MHLAPPKTNYMFVPWPFEPVQVNKMIVELYPAVYSTMKPPECVHAFQTNKTTLAMLGINHRGMLNTLGAQLNLSAIINGVLGYWKHHFCCNWCDFTNLAILLFHNNAGSQVNNATTAHDLAILLPVVDGAMIACCKQHICFVCIQRKLDVLHLITVDPPGFTDFLH
jgi:hypothetical protein